MVSLFFFEHITPLATPADKKLLDFSCLFYLAILRTIINRFLERQLIELAPHEVL